MWFKFPKGVERISVEHQEFIVEARDTDGNCFGRTPDHFGPRILSLGMGFEIAEQPEGAPADLPRADPLRDSAIVELTQTVEANKIEIRNLTTDLGTSMAQIRALNDEKLTALAKVAELEEKILALEEKMEDAGLNAEIVPIKKAK